MKTALENGQALPESFGLLKFLATSLTAVSGIPGGIFAPSLAVGAGIGSNVAQFFHGTPVGPIIILGMVSYFSGVVQAPITAFVIVTEMTDNHAMVVPVMTASVIAYACSASGVPGGHLSRAGQRLPARPQDHPPLARRVGQANASTRIRG